MDSSRCSCSCAQARGRGLPRRLHTGRAPPPACFTGIGSFAFRDGEPLHGRCARRTARDSGHAPSHEVPLLRRARQRRSRRRRRPPRRAPLAPRPRPRSPDRSTVTRPDRSSGLSAEAGRPGPGRASTPRYVEVRRSMWRIRLGRELPRYLLSAAATCGLLASLRLLVAPPEPRTPAPLRAPAAPDRAAEGYAVLFRPPLSDLGSEAAPIRGSVAARVHRGRHGTGRGRGAPSHW